MVRDELTLHDWEALAAGVCPFCMNDQFQPGPRDDGSQDFECDSCGMRFHIAFAGGMVVVAEVIGRRPEPDDWGAYRKAHPVAAAKALWRTVS